MRRLMMFAVVVAAGIAISQKFGERERVARRWAAATDPHPG